MPGRSGARPRHCSSDCGGSRRCANRSSCGRSAEPTRHFEFGERGITGRIIEGARRESSYFVPIAAGRRQTAQLTLEAEWTRDRLRANELVNRIREMVGIWRKGGYAGVTTTTARLLQYWTHPERDRKLFFCQIEAI